MTKRSSRWYGPQPIDFFGGTMRVIQFATAALLLMSAPALADHGGDRDCADFSSQAAAQAHFNAHSGDPDNLDADNDRIACESLGGGTAPVGGVDAGAGGSAGAGYGTALFLSGMAVAAGGGAIIRRARRT